jgi:hypothetical protein
MCNVPVHLRIPLATISFYGNAMLWFQTYEAQHSVESWPDLCVAVEKKFGKDRYQLDMRELLAIKQTTDVLDYASKFEQITHRILIHNGSIDEIFFVQKFLDGLKYNISNAISLHKPRTVDAALSLAIMQEDIVEAASMRFSTRQRVPAKTLSSPAVAKSNNQSRGVGPLSNTSVVEASPNKHKWDDKMAALRAARRAKGLCMKCGDTYNPQHRCPKQVPLHVLEEVLDIFQLDKSDEALSDSTSQESDEELLTLSYCASVGIQGKRTIRLQGLLQGIEVLILVDSGSSATFINEQLVQTLKLPLTSTQPMPVTVADGGKLIASSVVNNLTWWSQGNTFTHDTRVLPLGVYDLILGMDWLEKHSPMWVDWKRKEMRFTYQGKRITLVGVKDCTSKCLPLKLKKLKGLIRKGGVAQLVQLSAIAGDSQTTISP